MHPNPFQSPVNADSARANWQGFGWLALVWRHGFVPAILAAIGVVSVLPFNFAVFALWMALLVSAVWKQVRQQHPTTAWTSAILQVAVVALIVTAAHLAPGKTADRFLDRTITIPRNRMTLAELEGDPDGFAPQWRPFSLSITVPQDESAKTIAFPATTLTLRDFVHAVESQSTLRHRFAHCGNGGTILWGGDCCFGLHLRRPPGHAY